VDLILNCSTTWTSSSTVPPRGPDPQLFYHLDLILNCSTTWASSSAVPPRGPDPQLLHHLDLILNCHTTWISSSTVPPVGPHPQLFHHVDLILNCSTTWTSSSPCSDHLVLPHSCPISWCSCILSDPIFLAHNSFLSHLFQAQSSLLSHFSHSVSILTPSVVTHSGPVLPPVPPISFCFSPQYYPPYSEPALIPSHLVLFSSSLRSHLVFSTKTCLSTIPLGLPFASFHLAHSKAVSIVNPTNTPPPPVPPSHPLRFSPFPLLSHLSHLPRT
jgi:hypothetical protein